MAWRHNRSDPDNVWLYVKKKHSSYHFCIYSNVHLEFPGYYNRGGDESYV